MASPDSLAELRETARRVYALSFWRVTVPVELQSLKAGLHDLFDLLTGLRDVFGRVGAVPDAKSDQAYAEIFTGWSGGLDGLEAALGVWIDGLRRPALPDPREARLHVLELLPDRQVLLQAQEILSLFKFLLDTLGSSVKR